MLLHTAQKLFTVYHSYFNIFNISSDNLKMVRSANCQRSNKNIRNVKSEFGQIGYVIRTRIFDISSKNAKCVERKFFFCKENNKFVMNF